MPRSAIGQREIEAGDVQIGEGVDLMIAIVARMVTLDRLAEPGTELA